VEQTTEDDMGRDINKIADGYNEDLSDFTTFILEWDEAGKYRGQWQDDVLGDGPYIFIGPGGVYVPDLTDSEMEKATNNSIPRVAG
jgi:hypothetical protein